jgi:6-pyruvoyl-tetrahydropterin synthase
VTLVGEPDPVTGMVIDLKDLQDVIDREVMARFDHRDLNRDTPYFDKEPPTPENLARVIARLLRAALPSGCCTASACTRTPTRSSSSSDRGRRCDRADAPLPLPGRARAAPPGSPDATTRASTASARIRPDTGTTTGSRSRWRATSTRRRVRCSTARRLDALVAERVLDRFGHALLNDDPAFAARVPTAENIALVIERELAPAIAAAQPGARLAARAPRRDAQEQLRNRRGPMSDTARSDPAADHDAAQGARRGSRAATASSARRLRVASAMRFLTSGYQKNPREICNGALFDVTYDEMVIVKDIEFYSLCEHHMLPFFGRVPRRVRAEGPRGRAVEDPAPGRDVRAPAPGAGALTTEIARRSRTCSSRRASRWSPRRSTCA